MRVRAGFLTCAVAALGLLAAGCNDSHHDSPTTSSANGQLAVQMTDATTDLASSVNVYVKGLTVKSRTGVVTHIASDIGMVDVLKLKGTTRMLVQVGVRAGDYEYVQVELDPSRSNVVLKATGETMPLQIASAEIKVLGGFTVPEGGSTTVTLDFQADPSLEIAIDGHWILTPVILLASATVSA